MHPGSAVKGKQRTQLVRNLNLFPERMLIYIYTYIYKINVDKKYAYIYI